jgi:hypothetical protein
MKTSRADKWSKTTMQRRGTFLSKKNHFSLWSNLIEVDEVFVLELTPEEKAQAREFHASMA